MAPDLTYVPDTGYVGPDRFVYRARDGEADSAPATVNITVRLGKYAVFAQEGVSFEQNSAVVRGDVGVNIKSAGPFLRNDVEASFSQNSAMQDPASRVLADSIVVDNNGVIYNPSYNDLSGKGKVNGTRTTPLALPLRSAMPALPTITPGTQAINVSGNQTLVPGSYGALTVNNGAVLVLSGGLYQFASWTVDQEAKVHFAAPSEVRIAGALLVSQKSYIGPVPGATNVDANRIVFYVAGSNGQSGPGNQPRSVALDQNATISAYVVAPNGMINFRQNVVATGAFVGKWVLAEQNSAVTRPGDAALRTASEASVGSETAVVTPTEVVTTTPELLTNTVFLPLVQTGETGISATADEDSPAITVADPLSPTDAPTETAKQDTAAPVDGGVTTQPVDTQ